MVVFLVINYVLQDQLLIRPFARLRASAAALAKGDFELDNAPYIRNIPNDEVGELFESFNAMARDIIDKNERLRAVVDTTIDGIIVIDSTGRVYEFSPAAERIFGYQRDEVIGHNVNMLMPDPYRGEHDKYLAHYQAKPDPNRIMGKLLDLTGLHKNGTIFPMELAVGEAIIGQQRFFTGVIRDITKRKQSEEQLRRSQQSLLAQAQKMAGLGSWEYNLIDDQQAWSEESYRILGHAPDDVALSFDDFYKHVHPDDRLKVERAHAAMFDSYTLYDIEYRLLLKNSEVKYIHERSEILRDVNDQPVKAIGTLLDVTKRVLEAGRLDEARQAAEAAAESKSRFLANMSHEIRTPMNVVIGMSQLTLKSDLSDKQRGYVEKIDTSARALLHIIDDILDISKIESGGMRLEQSTFRLDDLLSRLDALIGTMANDKAVAFSIDIDPRLPRHFVGDELRLGQVLINLSGNAVKFTDSGGSITFAITMLESSQDKCLIQFSVTDNGIGMTDEQLIRLFQPFMQADNSTTREYGGTGLGLAISKNLIDLMGGRIWAKSSYGHGSTFNFTVHLGMVKETPVEITSIQTEKMNNHLTQQNNSLQNVRLLLVDDNEFNREVALDLLDSYGLKIEVAQNGQQALEMLEHSSYDGVLMDCMMPVMDGYEATRRIRNDPRFKQLPVIAMTANVMTEDRERCLACGMNDHIGKPLDESHVISTIARWIKHTQGTESVADHAIGPDNLELPGIDTAQGLSLARGRLPFLQTAAHL